ncbi:translation initiation factor IF-2 N-terminal domain-containing protein [Mycobacterium botniense]|uniref:Ribonuclease E n=1 Tax=Mycobacterium botniense TaxID=84962 RepID=A0A7I9XZS0_9MYCO|nr:translation initiation factor IF-2 N-terminal domain-containing protein [Mycobacterium botniense]GFG75315.1 ribonuclease E [Mycobacterium botniense]
MVDGVQSSDLSKEPTQQEDLPDRLRVHSLARELGTTSQRVLDALTKLGGRMRSAHSSLDRAEAARVRDLLVSTGDVAERADLPGDARPDEVSETGAPESRPVPENTGPRPEYMPLFVAPKPIEADEPDDFDDSDDIEIGEEEQAQRPASRRRRRGRRGRGRGRGEQGGSDERSRDGDEDIGEEDAYPRDAEASGSEDADSGESDEIDEDDNGAPEVSTRRRRRRRRRKSGSGDDNDAGPSGPLPDDPPNTVVHERVPRTADKPDVQDNGADGVEIQGIDGSTRLEAKRQRRRDGRDASRRRPPVLSEAEFLARREAVERVMVVRDKVRTEPPHQGERYTQIAVLEDGIVVEHFVTSAASASLVGNIYLGIVQNVLPSMEAAFVDIGRGRNGVLYAGEVNWEAAGLGGDNRKIEQALKPGDYVMVQVSKDPVGHKGARLTTQVSLAGRYLVYVPGASSTGISRKLPDTERQRLKEILREVVPDDAGVIIRTASEGVKEEDIRADITRLQERWNQIQAQAAEAKEKAAGAAVALYEEPDVLVRVIRDLFNEDFAELIVSGDEAWRTINEYVNSVAPDLVSKLTKYQPATEGGPDVFAVHRIDEQLAKAMERKVWLPSGGTLVIDRTEAMTVIDVNTGKFTGSGGNLEQTVTKNNLEAAEEIVRQLRLRDIGGIVVIDFIDMVLESNRDLVLRRLTEALARDRTRHQVSEVTSLGLVQLTRKRLGTGLIEAFSTPCPHCGGRGIVLHADPVDSAQVAGRKGDSGRRSRRSKRARPDEPVVAKVPAHTPGEHPLFKAMAAANGRRDGEPDQAEEELGEEIVASAGGQAVDVRTEREVVREVAEEDLDDTDDEDFEDSDEDDEVELDDEDLDDDLELDDDLDVDDDADEDPADEDIADAGEEETVTAQNPVPVVVPGPRRRRAAARPAGPPSHRD